MTRQEAERRAMMNDTLRSLGFTRDECESLRRISMTLRRWHELECGIDGGCIERNEKTGRPVWVNYNSRYIQANDPRARHAIPDREAGAKKRLAAILARRNGAGMVCPNCQQWQAGGLCLNECVKRGLAQDQRLTAYIQTDPRGAALYILRPGDVPAGKEPEAYYTRGVCVY